jgi:hypothetical protein
MQPLITRVRKPVEREGAEFYLLLLLLSFAASVSITRLFLELTGYPQLGNTTLHIAHVLWGGLLLFISALLMLIYANRWVYRVGAILAGVGVGLFMDEVGKFITQTNDYFFPPAASIIYAFFLLVVIFYMEVRRPNRRDARSELYRVLDTFEEVLDRDLDAVERKELEERLHYIVKNAEYYEFANLAEELLQFIESKHIPIAHHTQDWSTRLFEALRAFDQRWFTRGRMKAVLLGGLAILGIWAMRDLTLLLLSSNSPSPAYLIQILVDQITHGRVTGTTSLAWLTAGIALKAALGLALFVGIGLFLTKWEAQGLRLIYFVLLLFLTVADLLEFYFHQFSTIVPATVQFLLLLLVIHYRGRFMRRGASDSIPSKDEDHS